MAALLWEWLALALRWAHVVAAIMWIGDSFLFMWMDRSLETPRKPREGDVIGELWMTHGGGFYEVVKRRSLTPEQLPPTLHWFKWESYSTWISGFFLITVVYWVGGQALLVLPDGPLSHGQGVALSLVLLFAGVGLYDLFTRTPLAEKPKVFGATGLPLIMLLAWALSQVFTPRAVFLQVGAMLATIMSSNVFLRIIPGQKRMVAATAAGQPVDTSYGVRGKKHSTFNHYMTFPVLLCMLSNHFPSVYATSRPWLAIGLLAVVGVGVKQFMNVRFSMPKVQLAGVVGALVALAWLTMPASATLPSVEGAPPVSYATVQGIVQSRCVTCHAERPTNPAFPSTAGGVVLEKPSQVRAMKDRILVRAVHTKSMPLGNLTGMTEEERTTLATWIAQGADVSQATAATPPTPVVPAPAPAVQPAIAAAKGTPGEQLFSERCALCHGAGGRGDGPAAAAMNPKPRNFTDKAWQTATTDEALRKAIVEGGTAVGKSPLMPPNPDLATNAELLSSVAAHVRSLGK